MKLINLILVTGGLMAACSTSKKDVKEDINEEPIVEAIEVVPNPHAEGFNVEGSDAIAILLADQVMEAMGGRKNWNNTRYLYWNFFDARTLLWDKWTGDVRIEFLKEDTKILMNVRSMEGKVFQNGKELAEEKKKEELLSRGKSIWINDSYWLVMPFKLKDSGVTLRYDREDTTLTGTMSEVLTLTFEEVGDTPENKYEVWVDRDSKLVTQWAYYRSAEDSLARFTLPWGDYQEFGNILLSGERGDRDLTDIQVLKEVPEGIFTDVNVSLSSKEDNL